MGAPPSPAEEPVERMWRDAAEATGRAPARTARSPEFAEQADIWPAGLDRRDFLKGMGASLALGGLAACARPATRIVPYVVAPDENHPGESHFYSSVMPVEGYGRGILVQSHLGRPTKIEGNPDHPESLGATDAITQAAVLSLYDPDRSDAVLQRGMTSNLANFWADWAVRRQTFAAAGGRGLALLTEPTTSPSILRQIGLVLAAYPQARWYQHTPLAAHHAGGLQVDYDFSAADVVLLVGSDCWFRHPASIRYSRAAVRRHRLVPGGGLGSRIYAIEATPTLSGAMADVRLAASPPRMRLVLDAVAAAVVGAAPDLAGLLPEERSFVTALSADLGRTPASALCVAGPEQDQDVQAWALALNQRLGAVGRAVHLRPAVRSDRDPRSAGDLDALLGTLGRDEVEALFILGSNPAYTSRVFRARGADIARIPLTVHVGSHVDETAVLCAWHLPEAHFLETWGDLRGYEGTAAIQQPLIEPLHGGISVLEVLHGLHNPAPATAHELVRATWLAGGAAAGFEDRWSGWLKQGRVDEPSVATAAPASLPATVPQLAGSRMSSGIWLLLAPDSNVADGRWCNNGWLQELPRPLTEIVWDNALMIGPAQAKGLGIASGDLVAVEHDGVSISAAAWVLPGQADGVLSLTLGYGRTRAGAVGNGRGFDAYPLRPGNFAWQVADVRVTRTGSTYPLVSTQRHFTMEGRDPVHVLPADRIEREAEPDGTLYPEEWKEGTYAWGMTIDLSACTGCSACVAACQAENNTPVVGKDQVSRGREMHWIRIDRYFDGPVEAPRIFSQPVTCMHCENAPCELVCPVGATLHSSEGLNMMVYNRCVGTRYCSNNCPYKVRRFNFLDYRDRPDSPVNLQKNPDVTVRERGVMEKCTYCVQRINAARIDAAKANRLIRDGEIRTACQQACPVEAITFGNVADPRSRVSQARRQAANYSLLGELNTRPRTTYLSKVVAPQKEGTA